MASVTAAINIGSASKKYAFFADGALTHRAHLEETAQEPISTITTNGKATTEQITQQQYDDGFHYVWTTAGQPELTAAGIRIVCPGRLFTQHRPLDQAALEELTKWEPYASTHITATRQEIERLQTRWPELPLIAASDSAIHAAKPAVSSTYALPPQDSDQHEIAAYGYHGLSLQSTIRQLPDLLGTLPSKIIVCHLGSGTSVMAVKDGISVDTSMGFSPLSGVPMTTRIGQIDPAALLYLMQEKNFSQQDMLAYLYQQCGLKAISDGKGGIKDLLEASSEPKAAAALDLYTTWVQHYIGAFAAKLSGLDCLVFTGTAGQRSAELRRRITTTLQHLNVRLDNNTNHDDLKANTVISPSNHRPIVAVITAAEEEEIDYVVQSVQEHTST